MVVKLEVKIYKQHMRQEMTLRDSRVPVLLTADEKETLQKAADYVGLPLSTYIRVKALEAARGKD